MPNFTSRFVALILLLSCLGCAAADARDAPRAPEQPSVAKLVESRVRVEIARLEPSEAKLEFTFPGEVKGGRDALLASALGGLVEAVLVRQGESVRAGQALVRVDTSIYSARRDQARADHDQAKSDLERTQAMGEATTRAALEGATTRLRIAESNLRLAEAQLARTILTAPFSGVVAQLDSEVGEVAAPGAPMLRLVQLSPVKVSLSVADRDINALRPGMEVRVSTDASPEVFSGKVRFVSPAANLRTRAFEAEVEVDNPDARLLPGMIARVKVQSSIAREALIVPQHVVVTRRDGVGVFVEEDGRAAWRSLKLGQVVGDQVVVSSGVERGERLVVTGHRELMEGDRLDLAREGVCCTRGRVVFAGGEVVR